MKNNKEIKILELDKCNSTNDYIKEHYNRLKGCLPVMVIAGEQLKGKGRGGNQWISARDLGIYCSLGILLKTKTQINFLSLIAAISVIEVLKDILDQEFMLKWPNDIYVKKKKIAGILIENSIFKEGIFSIIGIGVNINQRENDFPPELKNIAISLRMMGNKMYTLKTINQKILFKLIKWIGVLEEGVVHTILDKCNKYSEGLKNKNIIFMDSNKKKIKSVFKGINNDGGAVLINQDQEEIVYYSGEIIDF